jgi:tetratricopeptide (TPR) repeat protein
MRDKVCSGCGFFLAPDDKQCFSCGGAPRSKIDWGGVFAVTLIGAFLLSLAAGPLLQELAPPQASPPSRSTAPSSGSTAQLAQSCIEMAQRLDGSASLANHLITTCREASERPDLDSGDRAVLIVLRAWGYEALGRREEASYLVVEAVRLAPDEGVLRRELGRVMPTLADMLEAERQLRYAIRLAPDDALAAKYLGDVLARTERAEEAHELYALATRLEEKSRAEWARHDAERAAAMLGRSLRVLLRGL